MPESVYESILALGAEWLLELRLIRQIPVQTPAIGAEWTITVPGGTIWEILAVKYVFSTSAAAGNRNPTTAIFDQDSVLQYRFSPASNFAPGTAATLILSTGYGDHLTIGAFNSSLPNPPLAIFPGFIVRSLTSAIDVGDSYSAITLFVRQWSETDLVQETGVIADQISSLYGREVTGR